MRVLVLDRLIPDDAGDACAISVATQGRRGDASVDVVLVDRDRSLTGDALAAACQPPPDQIVWVDAMCAPGHASRVVTAVRGAGCHAPIAIVTPSGELPPELVGAAGVAGCAPGDVTPIALDDFGALTDALLLNGLVWTDDPALVLQRPDRIHGPQTARDAETQLQRYVALCERSYAGPPPRRALRLRIDGATPFEGALTAGALAAVLLRSPLALETVTVRRGDGAALARAAEVVARYEVERAGVNRVRFGIMEPADAVGAAVAEALEGRGAVGALDALPAAVLQAQAPEGLRRRCDDAVRRVVFESVRRASPAARQQLGRRADMLLGPAQGWVDAFRRYDSQGRPRVVVVPTWQCELRCKYCTIVKQDHRVMAPETLDRALDLLLSSAGETVEMHFFGGEPFLEWPLLQHACREGTARASAEGRRIRFLFTTNAYSLTEARLDWLMDYDVSLQLSLDGDAETMHTIRRSRDKDGDSYRFSPAHRAEWFTSRGLPHDVIQVVHPTTVDKMAANFGHLLDMGYRTLQINYALGALWTREAQQSFARGLHAVGGELERRWAAGEDIALVNLLETLRKVRTNLHPTVDFDGTIYGGNGFLYLEKRKQSFRLGHLDDAHAYHRYVADGLTDANFFDSWYWKGSADNNKQVGAIVLSFVRHMRGRHAERLGGGARPRPLPVAG